MDTINLEISKNLVEPIIEAKIKAVIINAMGDQDALIGKVVQEVLNRRCNAKGEISQYSSDNKFPYIETQLRASLNRAIASAVQSYIAERESEIKQELLKALDTRKVRNTLVTAMVEGFTLQAKSPQLNITFEIPGMTDEDPLF